MIPLEMEKENGMENQGQKNPPLLRSSSVMKSENFGKIDEELVTKHFPNMATGAAKTLAQIDAPISSEPAHSQALSGDREGSGSGLGPAVRDQENGARVSAGSANEGLNGDICVGDDVVEAANETEVVETEISVQKNFGGDDGGFVGDAKVTGGQGLADSDSAELIGDGSDRKEFDQNGISVVAEVNGSLDSVNESGRDCGHEDDKGSMAKNGGDPAEKVVEIPDSVSKIGENGEVTGEGERKHEEKDNGKESEEDGEENEEDDEEEDEEDEEDGEENEEDDEEEDEGDQEHEYFVGDFVWGKIRSYPWWPGKIYDPSDASDYARKNKQSERLLVAYFGDGSFSWCFRSQLKPFAEDFEEMSKQSNSKSFVNAVQKALDEIGRLVESKMTCSCIPEENRIGLARPSAMNAGIKQGVLVSESDLSRLSVPQHGPELIATLRSIAEAVSIPSMLELIVLRSWLSAFYQAKGGHKLPMYHAPQHIEGLEDKNRNGVTDITGFSGPVEVPVQGPSEEDWLSSPVHHGLLHRYTMESLLQKCPGISEDKLHHRRKKKSVADLMKEDMVIEPNKKKRSRVKDLTSPGRLVSTFGKKKRKSSEEAPSQGGSAFTSRSGRNRGSRKKAESEEETKVIEVSSSENDDSDAKEETENVSASRERKKSRYLSPPFTSLKWRIRNSSSKRESEAESMEIAKETFQEKPSKKLDTTVDTSANSSPQQTKEDQKKIVDLVEINASTKEVVYGVRSAALNPLYLRNKISVDRIGGFISAFRSAIYVNGSNYKMYHKHRSGRKRKCLDSRDLNQTDHESIESKSQQTKNEKNEQAKSGKKKAKLKQSSEASDMKTNGNDKGEEASAPPVSLIVSFPPGISLPSKKDIIATFSKFGPLNEMETDVLYNSFCAKVVFVKSFYAEEAFKTCRKKNPLGPANVNYHLRYSTAAASRAGEGKPKAASPPKEGSKSPVNRAASQPSAVDEASRLLFIKLKLEKMTSMLEKSDGNLSAEMKSKLEGEMKGLLETVSTMAESTSS